MSVRSRPRPHTPVTTTDSRLRARSAIPGCPARAIVAVAVCVVLASACDRRTTPTLDVEVGPQRLADLTDSLNAHVARGELTTFDTGHNEYSLRLPGAQAEARFVLDLAVKTVFVPFGFARVRLNGLRFIRADCIWNTPRQALEVRLDLGDREDGVLAEVHTLAGIEDMVFYVSGGRVTLYLRPVVSGAGRLAWEPVSVEIGVNTDDAIPAVRKPLRDALRDVERDIAGQLGPQLTDYEGAVADWLANLMPARARLRDVTVLNDRAIVSADPGDVPEDTNGDGRVDIADVVTVAMAFGVEGLGPADVNVDGRVDITDLVAVAVLFGR